MPIIAQIKNMVRSRRIETFSPRWILSGIFAPTLGELAWIEFTSCRAPLYLALEIGTFHTIC